MGLSQIIGARFERVFLENFSDFYPAEDDGSIPDFFNEQFWVEAKTGNIRFGFRPHRYQVENFRELSEPVIYAIGFHNFDNARKRLARLKTLRGKTNLLNREMNIVCVYFVNGGIVEKVWREESRDNKKGTINYCVIKQSFLDEIIQSKSVNRNGAKNMPAEDYYGIDRNLFLLKSPQQSPASFDVGAILHKQEDAIVIDYLQRRGFL